MTSRRYFLLTAVALLAAHAAVLKWLGDAWPGPLLSDTVQLLMGVLVFAASLLAMRRSRTLGRLFWKLTAIAVLLWCAGQALGAYYGSYLNLPTRSLWFVDIFYVAWPAPLVMCLFLDSEEEPEGAKTEQDAPVSSHVSSRRPEPTAHRRKHAAKETNYSRHNPKRDR